MLTIDRAFAEIEMRIRQHLPFVESVHFHRENGMVTISATVNVPEWDSKQHVFQESMSESDVRRFPMLYHDVIILPMTAAFTRMNNQWLGVDMPDFETS